MITNHRVTYHSDGTVTFEKICPVCKRRTGFAVEKERYERWTSGGEYVQNVFPELPASRREQMISGTHSECFDKLFPPDENECNGMCMTAYDIGLDEYGSQIAYAHPDCPIHGDNSE